MILVFVGKMQSGKSSACNLIVGEIMKRTNLVPEYKIDDDGDLIIPVDESGEVVWGKFEPCRVDYDFTHWCKNNLWPNVKVFNFADPLKLCAYHLFNIPLEKSYGSNEDKNSITHLVNENIAYLEKEKKDKPLSVREVLERFAKICRDIDEDCFVNSVVKSIYGYNSKVSLVGDCRYPNEVNKMKEMGAKIIKLKRDPIKSNSEAERAQLKIDKDMFDLVIDSKVSLEEKNNILLETCENWGVFNDVQPIL